MPAYADVLPALRWRAKQLGGSVTARALADALTVDELPFVAIPAKVWPSVHAFRRLRSDVRLDMARKYMLGRGKLGHG